MKDIKQVTHCLKTWPDFWAPVIEGRKHFEVRNNDRHFRVGDVLALREWDPFNKKYSGRVVGVHVLRIWRDLPGVVDGHVVMETQLRDSWVISPRWEPDPDSETFFRKGD